MTIPSALKNAPVLVEIHRGTDIHGDPIIECIHHGLVAVVNGHGQPVFSLGDVSTPFHLRSCGKPFQVLPTLELGFFEHHEKIGPPGLKLADLALLFSSHSGQKIHTERVLKLLQAIGLDQSALRCGIHPPQDEETRMDLQRSQTKPTELHNNCSGKHTAMLMACLKMGFDIHLYEDIAHPLQQWIKSLIAKIADCKKDQIAFGIDGCSLPSWVVPLEKIALMYARLSYWQDHLKDGEPAFLAHAFKQIWTAATMHPEYVAGTNRFDTELMRSGAGMIFSKTGADGMHSLAVLPCDRYPAGLGIAIKILDGDPKNIIRPMVIKALLSHLHIWPADKSLDRFFPTFKNFRGLSTGGAVVRGIPASNPF